MTDKIFNFPDYFYDSLNCSKEQFNEIWNSISISKKTNLNMWGAVSLVCMELSNQTFYKKYKPVDVDENFIYDLNEFIIESDDYNLDENIVYHGYDKIKEEQEFQHIQVRDALFVYNMLENKFSDVAKFKIIEKNKISIIMSVTYEIYLEDKFKIFRDALFTVGWYMSIYRAADKAHNNTNYKHLYELVFEPLQLPEVTIDIRKDNDKIYHITNINFLSSIKKQGLIPNFSANDAIHYSEKRIYFLKEKLVSNSFESTIKALCSQKSFKRNNADMCCLVINVSKIPDSVKFYYDTHNEYGLFATDTIPYNAVEHIYRFDKKYKLMKDVDLNTLNVESNSSTNIFNNIIKLVKKAFNN